MVISFSGRPDAKKLPDWVSPELRDRIGATKVLVLPPFQKGEALQFIQELIAHFRIPGQCPKNPYFPFTKDTCDYIATYVAKKSELRPRALMHVLNAVLEAADPMLEQGQLTAIEPALTERVLLEYADVSDQKSDRDE